MIENELQRLATSRLNRVFLHNSTSVYPYKCRFQKWGVLYPPLVILHKSFMHTCQAPLKLLRYGGITIYIKFLNSTKVT